MFPVPKLLLLLSLLLCLNVGFAQQKWPDGDRYHNMAMQHRLAQLPSRSVKTPSLIQATAFRLAPKQRPVPVLQGFQMRQQAICYDTSERYFLSTDSITYYSNDPVLTPDGHVLLSGEYAKWNGDWDYKGYLLKADQKGNVVWLRTYDSLHHQEPFHFINYQKVLSLKDGTIFLAGRTNNRQGENYDIIFTKLDANGDVIWNRLYKSRLWTPGNGSADYWVPHETKEDPFTGEIYISAAFWGGGSSLIKLDPANGSIIWSRSYNPYDYAIFDAPLGLDIRTNEIRFFSRFLSYRNGIVSAYRLDKQTGDTLQTRFFKSNDTTGIQVDFLGNDQLTILQNGNYALSGKTYGQYQYLYNGLTPLYQAAVLELDSNLNFVRAYAFRNYIESNGYNSRMTVFPDGTALFTMLRYKSGYSGDTYYVQTRDGQIVKQRRKYHTGEGHPYEARALRFADGSDVIIRLLGDSVVNQNKIEVMRMHTSDTSSLCLGVDDASTEIYPFRYEPERWGLTSVLSDLFFENGNKTLTVDSVVTTKTPGCFTVAHCDFVMLNVDKPVICLSEAVMLTIRKNKACGAQVPLRLDSSVVQSIQQVNDSTYRIRFKKAWSGFIAGSVQSCTLLWDSVQVQVLEAPAKLDLGADTVLCSGNVMVLNARKGYATYLWQDGSADSTYFVKQPGLYHVTTTNACGGTFHDTVVVSAAPPIPFSVGPDRNKCNGDTVHLAAPAGFLNYSWSNQYNISSTTTQTVVVNPLVDTAYFVRAEKTPGCFAFDTVRVKVYTAPAISLGSDLRFCAGDSVLLNAGNGFATYEWNTGTTSQHISVKDVGSYTVTGTTTEGCKSTDTLQVIQVFSLPQPRLDKNSTLCFGESKILDAGAFAAYRWQDGSTTRILGVNAIGKYSVTVTDANGCSGSDSTAVTTILPLPSGFLPLDTAICSYSSLQLKPNASFQSYQWSTGGTTAEITISQPGAYTLIVKDNQGCNGKDTIRIVDKNCLSGFYAPSAFSPNGDGKNDQFRPLLFGNVKSYRFTIYSRWGDVVFQTTELQRGWNGKITGIQQETGVFIWTCTFQLEGEHVKQEKGTVVLMR